MGATPTHGEITKATLVKFRFSASACESAAKANMAVDAEVNQGATADKTVLHAMAGFTTRPDPLTGNMQSVLQTEKETDEAVKQRVEELKKQIVAEILSASTAFRTFKEGKSRDAEANSHWNNALTLIGQALHTVQDREFHQLEPWIYDGTFDSIILNPNYMFAHAIRDMGPGGGVTVNRDLMAMRALPFRPNTATFVGGTAMYAPHSGQLQLGAAVDVQVSISAFIGIEGYVDPLSHETAGMMTFTIGGGARGAGVHSARRSSVTPREALIPADYPMLQMANTGPAAYLAAEKSSESFIRDVQIAVEHSNDDGVQAWAQFVRYDPSSKASAPALGAPFATRH